jgi:hypothetical protein
LANSYEYGEVEVEVEIEVEVERWRKEEKLGSNDGEQRWRAKMERCGIPVP